MGFRTRRTREMKKEFSIWSPFPRPAGCEHEVCRTLQFSIQGGEHFIAALKCEPRNPMICCYCLISWRLYVELDWAPPPFAVDPGQLAREVTWSEVSRGDAEQMLLSLSKGDFIVRWNAQLIRFYISYRVGASIQHIAVQPIEGMKVDMRGQTFETLHDCLDQLEKESSTLR